jgi:hypothetical protein
MNADSGVDIQELEPCMSSVERNDIRAAGWCTESVLTLICAWEFLRGGQVIYVCIINKSDPSLLN